MADGVKRKISAILSADVVGYSKLMEADEQSTVRTVESYRRTISSLIEQHDGRVIDSPGDNILSEFGSVVDAVQCAVEIQHIIRAKNAGLPEARRMQYRIGINLGDVIEEENRIYGEGVNIAARIEGMADPGGICISGTAYDQVVTKLALGYEDMGEHTVKNIDRPVKVYRIPIGTNTESEKMAGAPVSLAEKPLIAVLPFDNMSSDPEQEYFSDGIVEEIIARLSVNSSLAVISRNSTFSYKGKRAKVTEVGKDLGARYVVEGSIRKAGNRIRITAQLIDATSDRHLWARTYDRELTDIFDLQDEIAERIAASLNAEYTDAELKRVRRIPTDNLTAYDSYLRGLSYLLEVSQDRVDEGMQWLRRAINLDPEFPDAYASLAFMITSMALVGLNKDPEFFQEGMELARKAISLDDTVSEAHIALAQAYRLSKQHENAMLEVETAIALNPSDSLAYTVKGAILRSTNRSDQAIEVLLKAKQLDPIYSGWCLSELGMSYRNLGYYQRSVAAFKDAFSVEPDHPMAYWELTETYRLHGDYSRAIATIEEGIARSIIWPLAATDLARTYSDSGDYDKAIQIVERELSTNPDSPSPCGVKSLALSWQWVTQQTTGPQTLDQALELARKVSELAGQVWEGHWPLFLVYTLVGQLEDAAAQAEEIAVLSIDDPIGPLLLAHVYNHSGRAEESTVLAEKALQDVPNYVGILPVVGHAYRLTGQLEKALAAETHRISSDFTFSGSYAGYIELSIIYVELDRMEEAKAEAAELLRLVPHFSVEVWGERNPMKDREQVQRDMAALRKAGLE